jgi:hypothetical protein
MKARTCSKYEVEYKDLSDWEYFHAFVQWITDNDLELEVHLCYNGDILVSDWFEFDKQYLTELKNHEKYDKKWDKLIDYMLLDSDLKKSFVRVELF